MEINGNFVQKTKLVSLNEAAVLLEEIEAGVHDGKTDEQLVVILKERVVKAVKAATVGKGKECGPIKS